ncbi:MAG: SUF system NifU family Fe-S cluster assembly protein, partial [Gemmatimonadota bacterium]|nr:SUF system NifU family Fe-S cluster assembly protein [Gemmatimonadota bacterium]
MSDAPLSALYQELILDHYRRPRNRGALEAPDAEVRLNNPTCGDEIVLQLRVRDGVIEDVRFGGQGCSISQASASMMTQQLKGRPLAEADALTARFK